jgi:hypothetical protein
MYLNEQSLLLIGHVYTCAKKAQAGRDVSAGLRLILLLMHISFLFPDVYDGSITFMYHSFFAESATSSAWASGVCGYVVFFVWGGEFFAGD